MKKFDKIDEAIRNALTEEELQYYHDLDQQTMSKMFKGLYTGKFRGWAILLGVLTFLFFVIAVYSVFHFLGSEDIREMLKWGLLTLVCFQAIGILKIWSWMQMDKNAIIQEMKKQEFRMSILSESLLNKRSGE